jgi:4-carboxymuconolactone decarboxylase
MEEAMATTVTEDDHRAAGREIMKQLGREGQTSGRDEEFSDITLRMLYGDIFARPGLSLRDRELITMAVMVAIGADFDRLYHHFKNAPNLGITDREMREMIYQVMFYAGWPRGASGIRNYNRVKAGEERVEKI